jgi:hypothetical protein
LTDLVANGSGNETCCVAVPTTAVSFVSGVFPGSELLHDEVQIAKRTAGARSTDGFMMEGLYPCLFKSRTIDLR